MENFDQVQRAYNELIKSGDIYTTSDSQQIENQKAYLTRRAAYYLNLIDSNIGLLSKTTGNNVMGLSTDIVMKRDGDYYDIATDSAGLVQPVNSGVTHDSSLVSKWVQPTLELAGLTTNPIPVPVPPSNDYQKILDILATISKNQDLLVNIINISQPQIMSKLDEIVNKPVDITFPDYKSSGWLSITLHPVGK